MQVRVLGAGVIGLTTALFLKEKKYDVELCAEKFSPHTHSDAAAALWYPSKIEPVALTRKWAASTLEKFIRLSKVSDSGVRLIDGIRIFDRPMGFPWWKDLVPSFERIHRSQLGPGQLGAYRYTIPAIDMQKYLAYLRCQFETKGGRVVCKRFHSIDEALEGVDVLVHCSGVGAIKLNQDKTVYPVRGQTLEVEGGSRETFFLEETPPRLYLPHEKGAVVGVTETKNDADLSPRSLESKVMLEKILPNCPELRDAKIKRVRVGLRCFRPTLCFESKILDGKQVIHNYGHQRSGVTLSWGGAEDVEKLVREFSKRLLNPIKGVKIPSFDEERA